MTTRTPAFRMLALLAAGALALAAGCAQRQPLPQPRKVVDPGQVPGAVNTADWEIAAVAYEYMGQGVDYREAGLFPVFLVFKNKSVGVQPSVASAEARGVTLAGEYLPYSVEEATRLVFDSETFRNTTGNVARSGGLGALAGASLGALIGLIGGGDNIWKGAVIGGTIGAAGGGLAGGVDSERRLRASIRDELERYAWTDAPVPPTYTQVGYLYLPDKVGVHSLKILVRWEEQVVAYTVPVVDVVAEPPGN
jgi:hypothetical protein